MIKNNKGFMLIEAIVTSTMVLTILVALYTSFNKLYNNYRIKNTYYNIDASYATKEMINLTINTNTLNSFINEELENKAYGYFIKESSCFPETSTISSCQNLQKLYNINNVILLKYSIDDFNELKADETELNQTFYDYIDYLMNYYDLENLSTQYNYIVLTEIKDQDKYSYAAIRVR